MFFYLLTVIVTCAVSSWSTASLADTTKLIGLPSEKFIAFAVVESTPVDPFITKLSFVLPAEKMKSVSLFYVYNRNGSIPEAKIS